MWLVEKTKTTMVLILRQQFIKSKTHLCCEVGSCSLLMVLPRHPHLAFTFLSSCTAERWSVLWCRVVQEGARHAVHLNQLVWTVNVHCYSIEYTLTVNNWA